MCSVHIHVHVYVKMDYAVAVEVLVFLAVLCNSVILDNLPSFKSCHKLLTDLRVVFMVTFSLAT